MKKIAAVSLLSLMLVTGITPALAATPSVTVSGSPEVLLLQNPACQEVIYTYLVDAEGISGTYDIIDAALSVFNDDGEKVMDVPAYGTVGVISGGESAAQEVTTPCKAEARYELYSDNFTVDTGEVEDITVKIFFTPEVSGIYQAVLEGIVFATEELVRSGGGECLNCVIVEEAEIAVLGNTISKQATIDNIAAKLATLDAEKDAELIEILTFVKMLLEQNLI